MGLIGAGERTEGDIMMPMVRVVLALKLARLTIAAVHDDEQQQDDDYDGDPDHNSAAAVLSVPASGALRLKP